MKILKVTYQTVNFPISQIDKISIETIFPWKKGSLLIFDRGKLHCSDNFLANGLPSKRGFVIWTEYNL